MNRITIILLTFLCVFGIENINAQQPDLNYFLEQAKLNSPLLQQNKANTELIRLDLQQTERILKSPVINLESNVLFAPIISHDNNTTRFELTSPGATNYIGYDQAYTDGGQFQAFVTLNQPLLKSSSLKAFKNKSEIADKQNKDAIQLNIHELEQLVGYQFVLCRKSKKQLENLLELNAQLKEQFSTLKLLAKHAIYKQTDVMLMQLEFQNAEIQLKASEEEFNTNIYDLYLLCGIKESINNKIEWSDIILKPTTVTNSQFLNSYSNDSLNVITDQIISELKYKPQLNLFANAGMNAVYLPGFDRFGFSTGLNFSWNIFDGNQRKIEAQKSTLKLKTISFEKDHFSTQKQLNLKKIQLQINALDERILLSENQLKMYTELYQAYQKQLVVAEISIMDFKIFLRDFTTKKQEKSLLDMEKQILINAYNYWNY
ncbi:MAG: TolC family protein [Paludibacter sp.]|nr:TolC family protein [Paludibacter sp.]